MSSRPSVRSILPGAILALSILPCAAFGDWMPNGSSLTLQLFGVPTRVTLAPDGSDGAFVATGNGQFNSILARVRGDGSLAAGWPSQGLAYLSPQPYDPQLVPDGEGGTFAIASLFDCSIHCDARISTDLRFTHVTAAVGTEPSWPVQGLDTQSGLEGWLGYDTTVRHAVSIPGGPGSALTTWSRWIDASSFPGSRAVLCIQRVDADATEPWGHAGIVIHSVATGPFQQAMATDGEGGAFVFFTDARGQGLAMQHVDHDGHVLWQVDGVPLVGAAGTVSGGVRAVPDDAGGAIVAWIGTLRGRSGVFATAIDSRGNRVWRNESVVFDDGAARVDGLQLVAERTGGAVLAWRVNATDDALFAQRLDRNGTPRWQPGGAPVCTAAGIRDHMALASDGRGGAYVAWSDANRDYSVYATHLSRLGTPAAGWAPNGTPLSSRTTPLAATALEAVDIQMIAVDGRPSARTGATPLREVGATPENGREGSAIVAWVNFDLCDECNRHSARFARAMRLDPDGPTTPAALTATLGTEEFAQVGVSVPVPGISLHAEAAGDASVSFRLPSSVPASLELFDLSGRRIWSRDVGTFGTGVHSVRIADGVPPGVYLARLTQGEHRATARLAIVR